MCLLMKNIIVLGEDPGDYYRLMKSTNNKWFVPLPGINSMSSTIGCVIREVAFNRQTGQSSDFPGYEQSSALAVDGDMATFSCTREDNPPYWYVDLGGQYQVHRIEIYNRQDCCGERLRNLDVLVGPSLDTLTLCSNYQGPSYNGEHLIVICTKYISGQIVKLVIQESEYLQLGEVKVYGCELRD